MKPPRKIHWAEYDFGSIEEETERAKAWHWEFNREVARRKGKKVEKPFLLLGHGKRKSLGTGQVRTWKAFEEFDQREIERWQGGGKGFKEEFGIKQFMNWDSSRLEHHIVIDHEASKTEILAAVSDWLDLFDPLFGRCPRPKSGRPNDVTASLCDLAIYRLNNAGFTRRQCEQKLSWIKGHRPSAFNEVQFEHAQQRIRLKIESASYPLPKSLSGIFLHLQMEAKRIEQWRKLGIDVRQDIDQLKQFCASIRTTIERTYCKEFVKSLPLPRLEKARIRSPPIFFLLGLA